MSISLALSHAVLDEVAFHGAAIAAQSTFAAQSALHDPAHDDKGQVSASSATELPAFHQMPAVDALVHGTVGHALHGHAGAFNDALDHHTPNLLLADMHMPSMVQGMTDYAGSLTGHGAVIPTAAGARPASVSNSMWRTA